MLSLVQKGCTSERKQEVIFVFNAQICAKGCSSERMIFFLCSNLCKGGRSSERKQEMNARSRLSNVLNILGFL
jgi:hypothetical protein